MPSTSSKQHRAMEAAAHGKSTLGIPASVGRDFSRADGDKSFAGGGILPMPTMGVSSSLPPPPGKRTEGPRNYGKK